MTPQPAWRRYLRLFGPDVRRDVDDEFDFHIATRAQEYVEQGMAPDAARARAITEFGDMNGARRECEAIGTERLRRRRWSEIAGSVGHDARYAVRTLLRTPGFTVVALLTLALGIGGTTAIFSVVHGVLLRPLPFAHPDALVRLYETTPQGVQRNVVAPANFLDWRAQSRSFIALGAHRFTTTAALTGDGDPVQIHYTDIQPTVLDILGVAPLVGRRFTAEDAAGTGRVVLLSYGFWQQRFGGDPNVVGRRITLDEISYEIVGVMPPQFIFPSALSSLWRVVRDTELDPTQRRSHNWHVIGRLRPGVTLAAANAEMRTIAARLAKEYPLFNTGFGVNVFGMHADLASGVKQLLLVLLGGAAIVLIVACVNIANLLLARALAREREIAVRGALGAGRGRLLRQLLTEALVLALTGGVLGVAVGAVLLRGLLAIAPRDVPRLEDVHLALPVLLFAAAATIASALLFGLVPALRLAHRDLQSSLRAAHDRTGSVGHAQLRGALLVGEVALSLVLLVGAGLLLRSAQRLHAVDLGYRTENLLTVFLDLPRTRYDTVPKHTAFYQQVIERVRAIPGVVAAAGTSEPPASGYNMTFGFVVEGRHSANAREREDPRQLDAVTPGFFQTLGIPIVQGRTFDGSDRAGATNVVILSRALAKQYWPGGDAIGQRISLYGHEGPWLTVVGVAGDTRMLSADEPPGEVLYIPHAQRRDIWSWFSWLSLLVRTAPGVDPHSIDGAVRAAVASLDPRIPVQRTATVEELYGQSIARRRFATVLVGAFAGMTLLLGVVGMYGVLSYSVVQRRREIGIRIALGASGRRVVRGVLLQATSFALAGVLIGGAAALFATRAIRSLLYEISPTDPVTFAGVAVLLLLVAAVAAFIPARRATRIDPLVAMREG